MQCISCGEESKKVICDECIKNNEELSFKDFKVIKCRNSGDYKVGGEWKSISLKNAVSMLLKKNSKQKIEVISAEERNKKVVCKIEFNNQEYSIELGLDYGLSDKEHKKGSKYYEGVVQIRNKNHSSYDEIVEKLHSSMNKKNVFSTKIIELKSGIDVYVSSKRFIQSFLKDVQKRYGGEVKLSPKLFSVSKSGKELYRLTGVIHLPELQKGDIIDSKNGLFIIDSMNRDIIHGRELKNLKKKQIKYSTDYEKIAKSDECTEVMVCQHQPYLEILHPTSYQCVPLVNLKESKKDKLKVIEIDGLMYAI